MRLMPPRPMKLTDGTDKADTAKATNGADTAEANEIDNVVKSDKADKANETNKANAAHDTNKANEAFASVEANELEELDEAGKANDKASAAILHPTKSAANYATPRVLLLFFVRNDPAIIISSLLLYAHIGSAITTVTHTENHLLFCVQEDTAIMINSKLQLIVGSSHRALIKLIGII